MPALPRAFLSRPIAHRALHDARDGRPENSRAAILAAIAGGYGIELDLQGSADGQAMVFHDVDLARLTGIRGALQTKPAAELGRITLLGSDEGIPTLSEILALVAGRAPLLLEIKDQDGAMGPGIGGLGQAVAKALDGYAGDVALMSFNPYAVAEMAVLCPDRARGLTTCGFLADDWPTLPAKLRRHLAAIPDFDPVGAAFVSHDKADPDNPALAALRARDVPVLCWTIRSPEEEAAARRWADNITFEGYPA